MKPGYKILLFVSLNILIFMGIGAFRQHYYDWPILADYQPLGEYSLVIRQQYPEVKYFGCYDAALVKANANVFRIFNEKTLVPDSAESVIEVYRDGQLVNKVAFDNNQTLLVVYGTLKFQEISEVKYLLLQGFEVTESTANYSVLAAEHSNLRYYFVHAGDLFDDTAVQKVGAFTQDSLLQKPQKISEDIWEFTSYADNSTQHWFYQISSAELSEQLTAIKYISSDFIVYPQVENATAKIVVRSIFYDQSQPDNQDNFFKELYGDFATDLGTKFLLHVEMTIDAKLRAVFIGSDQQKHTVIYNLD